MSVEPLRVEETGTGLGIRFGATEVASYVTAPRAAAAESPRPYLHPLRTLGGTVVSG